MLHQPIHILNKASQVHQHPEHQHMDEYDDIVNLLKDHGRDHGEETLHVVAYVADACMGNNHLWQDMQLPNRKALSDLMLYYFPTLAAKNTGDMKWKKFFYKQLCEREDIFICKSPSCGECVDYQLCFGAEE
jgi:nitrogen fixation protein NifQ